MKYSININQFCWHENNLTSLDIVDLALFDAIRSFMISDRAVTISVNQQVYYWVSPNLLIAEMPILGITTARGINKRIDNIIKAGLLERCPNNQSAKRTYFRVGENYNKYNCYNRNENSSLGTSVPTPTWNNESNNNNTNTNEDTNRETIINNSKEMDLSKSAKSKQAKPKVKYGEFVYMTEEEFEKLSAELGESGAKECIDILNNYKGSKGKNYKSDYLAIRSWVIDRYNEKHIKPQNSAPAFNNSLPKWKAMGFRSQEEYINATKR